MTASDNALAGGLASVRRRTPLSRLDEDRAFGGCSRFMATISAMFCQPFWPMRELPACESKAIRTLPDLKKSQRGVSSDDATWVEDAFTGDAGTARIRYGIDHARTKHLKPVTDRGRGQRPDRESVYPQLNDQFAVL